MNISGKMWWRWCAWVTGAVLFSFYLWNANDWVLRWLCQPGDQIPCLVTPLDSMPYLTQYALDKVEVRPYTRLQKVSVFGWILPPSEWRKAGAEATYCKIILKGADAWYSLKPYMLLRQDVRDIFNIENTNAITGFGANFSPVGISRGVYRMGLLVCSGTNNLAVAWTPCTFIQDRKGFREQ